METSHLTAARPLACTIGMADEVSSYWLIASLVEIAKMWPLQDLVQMMANQLAESQGTSRLVY